MYRTDRVAENLIRMFSQSEHHSWQKGIVELDGSYSHYIDVDLSPSIFEVPLFLTSYFCKNIECISKSPFVHLAAPLQISTQSPVHVSIPTVLSKDVFLTSFSNNRLYKIRSQNLYYGTRGALFNKDMIPLFMCSWKVERKETQDSVYRYNLLNPILRIAPSVILDKSDSVQSFLVNKLLKTFLSCQICKPAYYTYPYMDMGDSIYASVQVILENIPFKITTVQQPSVSMTQQELKETVLDNIKDLDFIL